MNKRFISVGIGLGLAVILVLVVFGAKRMHSTKELSGFMSVEEMISNDKLNEARNKIDEIAGEEPDARGLGKAYFELADSYEKKGDLVKARDIYETILNKYQNIENILEVQERLGEVNTKILFSSVVTDEDALYEVEPGDTLFKIAKRFGTTIDLIRASNSIEGDMIRARSKLKVSKTKYEVVVDKSQNLLTLLTDKGSVFKVYKVSTGEDNSTPVGTFKIVNKVKDPVWYTQGAIVPAESPDNILGSRWLGLSVPGYGIHGTVDPDSVGTQATKGCIRMLPSDVEEFYAIVPLGTQVTIVD